tara:strand:- start:10291 stop:10758 length:468 start_codon:yes stop_codon:yes gene_type:complete
MKSTIACFLLVLALSCNEKQANDGLKDERLFPRGERNQLTEHFSGKVWTYGIVPNDSVYHMLSGSVHFDAGAFTDWHSHPGGQILIITEGKGFYQEEGREKRILKKGDVVKCLPNIRHWHGAIPNEGLTFIHIIPNTENGYLKWYNPVTYKEYAH